MPKFSTDIRVAMTVYVEAENEAEAIAKIVEHFGTERAPETAELWEDYRQMDEAGEVELSPAVTFYGRYDSDGLELIEGDDCQTCADATETRVAPCDECGALDEAPGD